MDKTIDILIVDDNREFCQLLAEFFAENEDFNVVGMLYDGEQALDYLKNNENPDVLILDLIMPHLDGIG
ncbi:MAG: response regulator, partial [Halanaerobium sp.]